MHRGREEYLLGFMALLLEAACEGLHREAAASGPLSDRLPDTLRRMPPTPKSGLLPSEVSAASPGRSRGRGCGDSQGKRPPAAAAPPPAAKLGRQHLRWGRQAESI